jgi:membrane-bound ClpP family serine protease
MRSKMLDKLALKKDIDSKVDRSAEKSVKVGDTGISTTRLAQIGYAEINGNIVEVRSIDGFLNEKTPIIVSRIADGTILVEKHKI